LLLAACSGNSATNRANNTAPAPPTPAVGSVTPGSPAPPVGTAGARSSATAGPAPPGATPAPQALSPSRVETVKLATEVLLDRYYKPLNSNDLLNAAWRGASGKAPPAAAQVTAPRLTGNRDADWSAFSAAYQQLYNRAGGAVSGTDLSFAAVQAMITSLHDDHTYFLSPQDNQARQAEDQGGGIVGIGVTLGQGPPWTIQDVVAGSPADQASVKVGDVITAVNGQDVASAGSSTLTNLLRGDEGTSLSVTLRKASGGTATVTLQRARIVPPALETRLLPGGIGYIALHEFADADARYAGGLNIAQTLDAALQSFEQGGVKGWVLDLRGNPGGSSQTLSEVAGRFQPTGDVLVSRDRNGVLTDEPVDGHLFSVQRPLAILINGGSASSSELLSEMMKEYGRAHLVGQHTAGAVNGGLVVELPDGAAFQYTVVEALSGKNHTPLDGAGVSPDDAVSGRGDSSDILSGGSDAQYQDAMQWVLSQAAKRPTLALQPAPAGSALPYAQVQSLLQPFAALASDVPADDASPQGYLILTHPNELAIGIAADTTSAAQYADTVRSRHWQGSYDQFFGPGEPQPFIITIDLYADPAGAHAAASTDDFSTGLKQVAAPAKLGDETVAYQGFGVADGSDQIVWRRGRIVFTVQFTADPGQESFAPALAVAQKLDQQAASLPQP